MGLIGVITNEIKMNNPEYYLELKCMGHISTQQVRTSGAELGHTLHKLGFDFTLIFCRFSYCRFGFVELVRGI